MAAPAIIRVKLDTSGAKSDLAALYSEAGKGIRVPVSGGGGGGGGGGVGSGSGVGGGGFNIASMLGTFMKLAPLAMLAAPIARDVGALGGGLLGGLGGGLSNALGLSGAAGGERGRQQAIQETAQMFGLARGLGLVGSAESQSFYDTIRPFREAAGRGTAEISAELGFENAKEMLQGITDAIKQGFVDAKAAIAGGPI